MVSTIGRQETGEGGFSLVELLVALVVVALLVVVAMPTTSMFLFSSILRRSRYVSTLWPYFFSNAAALLFSVKCIRIVQFSWTASTIAPCSTRS